jgi:hypothetical protein
MKLNNLKLLFLAIPLIVIASVALALEKSNPVVVSPSPTRATDRPALHATKAATLVPGVQTDSEQTSAKAVLLTIRPNGFEPAELTLPGGDYLLVVRNRTGLDEFAMRLERASGEALREVRVPRFRRDWKHFLRLAPGSYVIREMNHADWVCRITITG